MKTLVFCLAQTLEGNGLWYSDIETIQREYWSHNTPTDAREAHRHPELWRGHHAGHPGSGHHHHGQPADLGAGPGAQADLSPAHSHQRREKTRHQEGGELKKLCLAGNLLCKRFVKIHPET